MLELERTVADLEVQINYVMKERGLIPFIPAAPEKSK
jgi:hypothetical protein